jgi:hypothetical protein
MAISIFILIKQLSTHDEMKKRIHTYAFPLFSFILYIFVLLISHVHSPPQKVNQINHTRAHIILGNVNFHFSLI